MAKQIRKEFVGAPEIKDGTIVFRCSDATPDRVGDRVFAEGIDLKNYAANPVLLWNHDTSVPSLGTGKVYVQDGALFLEPSFSAANPLSQQIKAQVEAGELRAVSIGFIPLEGKPNDLGGMDWTSIELTEVSIVNVPCHPGALREKAMTEEDIMAALERILAQVVAANSKLDKMNADLSHSEQDEAAAEEQAPAEPAQDAPPQTNSEQDEAQKFFTLFMAR